MTAGTDLPELSFGIDAAIGMHGDLILGPILGCVLADALLTTGFIAVIEPIRATQPASIVSGGLLMVVSALSVMFQLRKGELNRKDGIILVVLYLVFLRIQFVIESSII